MDWILSSGLDMGSERKGVVKDMCKTLTSQGVVNRHKGVD